MRFWKFLVLDRTSFFFANILTRSELKQVYERDIDLLSGGELQRFAIGTVCVQQADV